jgi:copper resistance protein B
MKAVLPALLLLVVTLCAGTAPAAPMPDMPMSEMMDDATIGHAILEQFEGRWSGPRAEFRYDGQGWFGTDYDKLWLKSEGQTDSAGRFTDGSHEILYDRAISTYFDLQAGVRLDIDSGPRRSWATIGVQGLAVGFFEVEATAYLGDHGGAGRFKVSYDLLLTQRLILQPEAEMNVYSRSDPARGIAAGLSDIDAGLRLRYEITRKFAPYIGVSYQYRAADVAAPGHRNPETGSEARFAFGVRAWF